MPRVVAYMDDLFFQMKLAETAKHLHIEVKVAGNPDALLQLMDPLPKFVIVDLNARNKPLEAVEQMRLQQTDLAAKAKAAGFQQVMPRSQLTANLPQILAMAND